MLSFWSIVLLFFIFCLIQFVFELVKMYIIGRMSRMQLKAKVDDVMISCIRGFYQIKCKVGGRND